jgi:hypothetical protein
MGAAGGVAPRLAGGVAGSGLSVQPHGGSVQRPAERQGFPEELGAESIGGQAGELALQIPQLRRGALWEGGSERTEGARRLWPARAVMPARAVHVGSSH